MTLLASIFHRQLVPSPLRRGKYRVDEHLMNNILEFAAKCKYTSSTCISFTLFRFCRRFCARHVQLRERRRTSRPKARGRYLDFHYTSSILPIIYYLPIHFKLYRSLFTRWTHMFSKQFKIFCHDFRYLSPRLHAGLARVRSFYSEVFRFC